MYSYNIEFAKYKLRGYEQALALKEFERLFPDVKKRDVSKTGIILTVPNRLDEDKLKQLVFFSSIKCSNSCNGELYTYTNQAIRENYGVQKACNGELRGVAGARSRREIRYLSHALHEYKGRFYPQLAGALLNCGNVRHGNTVMDPFCGSGTTLVEPHLRGINAVGVDLNPVGVLISKAKIASLLMRPSETEAALKAFRLVKDENVGWKKIYANSHVLDNEYLQRWFPKENLMKIFFLLKKISALQGNKSKTLCLAVLSNLLREFSYQASTDLRIRRRKDEPPANVLASFRSTLTAYLNNLRNFQTHETTARGRNRCRTMIYRDDIRSLGKTVIKPGSIDAVVTSPPYATALPYIDTDRLSIVLLGYSDGCDLKHIEKSLIGAREITRRERDKLDKELEKNLTNPELQDEIVRLLHTIYTLNKESETSGFRRKNLAALLYKYFIDMDMAVRQIKRVLKKNGSAFIVVGGNRTTVNGQEIQIPTDDFIALIAESRGLSLTDKIPMTVQKSYMIHSKNSINTESVLCLRK